MNGVIQVQFERPIVDGSAAEVCLVDDDGNELIVCAGTMVYSQDLDQWNDAEYPGEVADKDPLLCAVKMVEFRK